MTAALMPLREVLDRAADDGRAIRVWLRDDDCTLPTPALDRLARLCDGAGLPALLATIPEPAEAALAGWIADHRGVTPCQHGLSHTSHARPGERNIELGGARPLADLLDDLARGRAKLQSLFGARLSDILVPPWNRIDPALVPHLPALGFSALSTIAPGRDSGRIPRLDADLDIVDWRHGRVGRTLGDVAEAAAQVVARADVLGILTHHLAHDETAWTVLGAVLDQFAAHRAARFADADGLIRPATGPVPPPSAIDDPADDRLGRI